MRSCMTMTEVTPLVAVQSGWKRGESRDALLLREWLVTNALGGYASGSLGGANTRRFHGFLIAALPAPLGRTMMFNHMEEILEGPGGLCWRLSGDEHGGRAVVFPEDGILEEFAVENGKPVWRFAMGGIRIEKRVLMPHLQNTSYIVYRLLEGPAGLHLRLRPSLHFRPHEGLLTGPLGDGWRASIEESGRGIEVTDGETYPPLRILAFGGDVSIQQDPRAFEHVLYRIEKSRGYEDEGALWSPGLFHLALNPGEECGLIASVERWEVMNALPYAEAAAAENGRVERLLMISHQTSPFAGSLVLAADQFLIHPHTRVADEARIRATGDEPRTIIAGYHWFTDWGRDTMISLEGLTLATGRYREAGDILRTFAAYIRDGLIPNLFPEGEQAGLYHTADATMWFFHAIWRFLDATKDRETIRGLIPKLLDIIDHHVRGTLFNIHVDPADGLLVQGADGYQLTWMDAKVGDWVVTPRRGKAVEINALWYNALRILEQLLLHEGDDTNARLMDAYASRARKSFNERFWYDEGQYLYDVVDANDASLRPNQIFAVSLDFPILDESRWQRVVDVVRKELLTPVGLRSLARSSPDYKPRYDGDLRSRDAAYHQGTVWAWLIGPFIDAWLRVHPQDTATAHTFLDGFRAELGDACIGTISEVFDAEEPFTPRGCVAQAWSVAEVLRALGRVDDLPG
ncbi:MAG TPA: amylo-alpha-1,6-glucosidase [Thermoanaerobaculia bacterium]|nr:amylo-alpha-1,6-glucosidase [Thermoanaerobaculia bacterium]